MKYTVHLIIIVMIYIDYSSYANNFMKREAKCKFYMDDNNFMKREAKFYMDDNFGPLRFIAVAKVGKGCP